MMVDGVFFCFVTGALYMRKVAEALNSRGIDASLGCTSGENKRIAEALNARGIGVSLCFQFISASCLSYTCT